AARASQLWDSICRMWVDRLLLGLATGNAISPVQRILEEHGAAFLAQFFSLGKQQITQKVAANQIEPACRMSEAIFEIALGLGNRFEAAQVIHGLGVALKNKDRATDAIGYEERALALYKEINDPAWIGGATLDLALAYKRANQLDRALEWVLNALDILQA